MDVIKTDSKFVTLDAATTSEEYLSPEIFRLDTDGDDDALAFQRMVNKMVETGIKGVLQSGKIYIFKSNVTANLSEGNRFLLMMNGAVIDQRKDVTTLIVKNNSVGGNCNVLDLSMIPYNLSNESVNTVVTKIVAPGHVFTSPGQIGRIFSDDIVPDSDAEGQYCAEYFVVGDIDGDVIYTTGILYESYLKNVSVCRPSNALVYIDGFSGASKWNDSFKSGFITIIGVLNPILKDFKASNINATFLSLTGCYRAQLDKIHGERIKNRPDLHAYGYLVNDSSSYYSELGSIIGIYARHAYTTTASRSIKGDGKWQYRGRTIGSIVDNLFGQGCANAADTHSPSLRISFNSVRTVDDYRGYTTGGAGIQLRGNSCIVNDADIMGHVLGSP